MRIENMAYSFPRGHENLNHRESAVKCEGLWKNKMKSKYIEINRLWYSELPNFFTFPKQRHKSEY